MAQLKLPADYLREEPDCPLCGDMGYIGSEMCQCFKRELSKLKESEAAPVGG